MIQLESIHIQNMKVIKLSLNLPQNFELHQIIKWITELSNCKMEWRQRPPVYSFEAPPQNVLLWISFHNAASIH